MANIPHASMFQEDSTVASAVAAIDDFHSLNTAALVAGLLNGWSFDAGGAGTPVSVASVADGAASGVDIEVTTTGAHGLALGDVVSQSGFADANYNDIFVVKAIISATQYEVAAVFAATGTGTMNAAATLTAEAGSGDDYIVLWTASAASQSNNEIFDFEICRNDSRLLGSKSRRKFGSGGDIGSMGGMALVTIVDGDKISFAVANQDSAGDITLRNFNLLLHRI